MLKFLHLLRWILHLSAIKFFTQTNAEMNAENAEYLINFNKCIQNIYLAVYCFGQKYMADTSLKLEIF